MKKKNLTCLLIPILMLVFFNSNPTFAQEDKWEAPANIQNRPNPFKGDVKAPEKGKKIYEKLHAKSRRDRANSSQGACFCEADGCPLYYSRRRRLIKFNLLISG